MRRSIFLCAVSFFSFAAITKGVIAQPVLGQIRTPEIFAKPVAAGRDIWVYGGAWCYWDGGGVGFGDDIDLAELGRRFLAESGYASNARPVGENSTIPGTAGGLYVLDSTHLYFPESDFYADGIYGFAEINLMSGKVSTGTIYSSSDLYISSVCQVSVEGQINSGGAFECYGGTVRAGDIYARKIWLDSSRAPLHLTVTDSVLTGFYTQCGGSVEIGGGLFAVSDENDSESVITVSGDFAYFNETGLTVGEDIVCAGTGGTAMFGSGMGGLDEAAFTAFIARRSGKKAECGTIYELTSKKPDYSATVTVSAGGMIRACSDVAIFDADITTGGEIESRDGAVVRY